MSPSKGKGRPSAGHKRKNKGSPHGQTSRSLDSGASAGKRRESNTSDALLISETADAISLMHVRKHADPSENSHVDRQERMREAVKMLLECVGEDLGREGLQHTPSRYSKALLDLTGGHQISLKDIVNNAIFSEAGDEMIIVKDIDVSSMCEHHLLPFVGKVSVIYSISSESHSINGRA